MKTQLKLLSFLALSIAMIFIGSCGEDGTDDVKKQTPQPVADFDFEIDAENPLLVHFTSNSVNAQAHSWSFGDGKSSSDSVTTHTYDSAGTYQVTLLVTNEELLDSLSKSFTLESAVLDSLGDNVIKGGDMSDPNAWTVMGGEKNGNVVDYEFTSDGKLHFSGAAASETSLHQLHVWQEIFLDSGVLYKLYADVEGAGLDWAYLELDLGTITPVENAEYQHPNIDAVQGINDKSKVVGVNNFLGCGNEAFAGNIIEVGCDGPALKPDPNNPEDTNTNGVIEVSYTGSYFFLIKAGVYGKTMGDGISIDNISLAPILIQ